MEKVVGLGVGVRVGVGLAGGDGLDVEVENSVEEARVWKGVLEGVTLTGGVCEGALVGCRVIPG